MVIPQHGPQNKLKNCTITDTKYQNGLHKQSSHTFDQISDI